MMPLPGAGGEFGRLGNLESARFGRVDDRIPQPVAGTQLGRGGAHQDFVIGPAGVAVDHPGDGRFAGSEGTGFIERNGLDRAEDFQLVLPAEEHAVPHAVGHGGAVGGGNGEQERGRRGGDQEGEGALQGITPGVVAQHGEHDEGEQSARSAWRSRICQPALPASAGRGWDWAGRSCQPGSAGDGALRWPASDPHLDIAAKVAAAGIDVAAPVFVDRLGRTGDDGLIDRGNARFDETIERDHVALRRPRPYRPRSLPL